MTKDVIYIDVEDDITAIIGKVKSSKSKIVALVPPKRIGVLQSAVNLRLIERTASANDKRMVIITGNKALQSLAASAKIPVAKNLQSKPELADVAALSVDDDNDIIDGSELPIGDHARMSGDELAPKSTKKVPVVSDQPSSEPIATTSTATKNIARPKAKVPNFNTFRKKLVFGILAAILLIAFGIWAIWFAPRATVYVTAETTETSVNEALTISGDSDNDINTKTLRASTQTMTKDVSIDFDATGSKDIGKKASGQIVFNNCEENDVTIPAGTTVSAAGKSYVTGESVTAPAGRGGFNGCSQAGKSGSVSITASNRGSDYNMPGGTTFNVSGHSNNSSTRYFNATSTTSISGGSTEIIKVVSSKDISDAEQELRRENADQYREELAEKFDENVIVLTDTFDVDLSEVESSPAQGDKASNGKAKLTGKITYTMLGVSRSEIGSYLDDYFAKQLEGNKDQRVYENGSKEAEFNTVETTDGKVTANLVATGKIGPKIEDSKIKDIAKGKRYGEIQSEVESIQGVHDVDVKYWPFWVSSAPDDDKRINIKFNIDGKK